MENSVQKPKEELHLELRLPAAPEAIYSAWIDSIGHRDFTGGNAVIDPRNGGRFSAWDGYITGILLKLDPFNRIVQSWRTSDFHPLDPSSTLEIILTAEPEGTLLTLHHTDIPSGQAEKYRRGWIEFYFEPMLGYFSYLAQKGK